MKTSTITLLQRAARDKMGCPEGIRLLQAYTQALSVFHRAQEPLVTGLSRRNPDYAEARTAREQAFSELARARGLYWKHVQMHGCRVPAAGGNRATENALRQQMIEARAAFDKASETFQSLIQMGIDARETSDGALGIEQARRIHRAACEGYVKALRRFSEYMLEGKLPEDEQAQE